MPNCQCSSDNAVSKLVQDYTQEFYDNLGTGEWLNGLSIGVITPTGQNGAAEGTRCCFGEANSNGTPVNPDTIFEIGSTSKTFTCTMLADAISQGKVDLFEYAQTYYDQLNVDVKLPTYLNTKTGQREQMRIVDLADYTSGIAQKSPTLWMPYGFNMNDLYSYLESIDLVDAPGTKYNYVNANFAILADILAKQNGDISYSYMLTNFLEKAGLKMINSGVVLGNSPGVVGMAQGYNTDGSEANYAMPTWPAFAGAGGIYSSLNDMLIWLSYNMNLRTSSANNLLDITQTPYFPSSTGAPKYEGLGWFLAPQPGGELVSKDGGTSGFHSWMGFYKGTKYGLVLMGNANIGNLDSLGIAILQELASQ